MTLRKGLVLDANILLRAVFGTRVRAILESYEQSSSFFCPDVCFQDARDYIPDIAARRKLDVPSSLAVLDGIAQIVELVDRNLYEEYEQMARARVSPRDPEDWPVAAVALLFGFPIWTEDQDFFGTGIASWTTDHVELYLRNAWQAAEKVSSTATLVRAKHGNVESDSYEMSWHSNRSTFRFFSSLLGNA